MQFIDLQNRAIALTQFGGYTDVASPAAPNWPSLVNQAWQEFSWEAECLVGSETLETVTGQAQYTLQNAYKELLDVGWNGQTLYHSHEDFERNLNPNWLNAPAGTSQRWVLTAFDTITITPPPNAASVLSIRGIQQGQAMALPTDQPGQVNGAGSAIPARYHDAIAYRAAVLWAQLFATDAESQRLAGYQAQYDKFVADSKDALKRR